MQTTNSTLATLEAERKASGKLNIDAAYCFAKALHHIAAGEFYLNQTVNESQATFSAKQFLRDLGRRAAQIVKLMMSKLRTNESKEILEAELADPLYLDQITDAFIALEPENRTKAEDYLADLLNSQKKAA